MRSCPYVGPRAASCGEILNESSTTSGDFLRCCEDVFSDSITCSNGHKLRSCKRCFSIFADDVKLFTHIARCYCGYVCLISIISMAGCTIYETKEIKKMMDELNIQNFEEFTMNKIVMFINSRHLKVLFPQFIYLQRNEEIFKNMDIGNINLQGFALTRFGNVYAITSFTGDLERYVKNIVDEFIRCSKELEFHCSITSDDGDKCGMMYDCLPEMNVVRGHINKYHS